MRTSNLIAEQIGTADSEDLKEVRLTSRNPRNPILNLQRLAQKYDGFIRALLEDVEANPESYEFQNQAAQTTSSETPSNGSIQPDTIFLVHGHDDANLSRLEKLLRERWKLNPIVLKDEPGQSRTIIEKFEEEASKAAFAFALLTPDDLVKTPDGSYAQSRPNVVFELGWFFGRLGRNKVCILAKKGTEIHSDLEGINQVRFVDSIEEAFLSIETELEAGGLI